jgi:hypothetical protein
MLPHPPRPSTTVKRKEISFKFKLGADKRPDIQQNEPIIGSDTLPDNDQAYVKVKKNMLLAYFLYIYHAIYNRNQPRRYYYIYYIISIILRLLVVLPLYIGNQKKKCILG